MKIFKYCILSLLGLIAILIFLAPRLLSTEHAKKTLIAAVEAKPGCKLQIGSLRLSWLGPQVISDLNFQTKELDLLADYFSTTENLFSVFASSPFNIRNYFTKKCTLKLSDGNLKIKDHNAEFNNINGEMVAPGNSSPLQFNFNGKSTSEGQSGFFDIAVTVSLHEEIEKLAIAAHIDCKDLPTVCLDRLLSLNQKNNVTLEELLGPTMNLQVEGEVLDASGSCRIILTTPLCRAMANLNFDKEKISLKEPAIISMNFQSRGLLSITPAKLFISNNGFYCPYNLSKLLIETATLDLGHLKAANQKAAGSLNKTLKQTELTSDIWFAPSPVNVVDGAAFIERIDFLVNNSLHLCLWGEFEFINDRLRMTLGVPSDSLTTLFNLKNLPDDYMLRIPIKGTAKNPKVDEGKISAEIASLVAAQSGKSGSLFDTIFGVLGKKNKEKAPDAVQPFPWEQ